MKHLRIYFATAAALAFSALAYAGGDASDGHSHGEASIPAMTANIAPRASAESEEFELVAVLEGKKLVLYLDRYASNEPVADAQIELENGAQAVASKAVATQTSPGVYTLPGEAFAKPGKYAMVFSVQAGETADLLTATLTIAPPAIPVEHVDEWDGWAVWGAAGALLLVVTGVVLMRRRG